MSRHAGQHSGGLSPGGIADLADQLFENVFEGDHARGATVRTGDLREMGTGSLHSFEDGAEQVGFKDGWQGPHPRFSD